MEGFTRYAIYYAPDDGPLADFGAEWLGWDAQRGEDRTPPDYIGLPQPAADITATPRKYGFHATIKPPFSLAKGETVAALHGAMTDLARGLAPVRLDGLDLSQLGHFLALTPKGPTTQLAFLASRVVTELDDFRAPPTEAEIARRNPDRLSDRQRALLARWGYPYVMEEFRFHMTLSGPLTEKDAATTRATLRPMLEPLLPAPFTIRHLCLFGEGENGRFYNLHRYALSG